MIKQLLNFPGQSHSSGSIYYVFILLVVKLPVIWFVRWPLLEAVLDDGYLSLVFGVLHDVLVWFLLGPIALNELEYVVIYKIILENRCQQFAGELLNVPILFGAFAFCAFLIFWIVTLAVILLFFEQLIVEEDVVDAFYVVEVVFDGIVLLYRIH